MRYLACFSVHLGPGKYWHGRILVRQVQLLLLLLLRQSMSTGTVSTSLLKPVRLDMPVRDSTQSTPCAALRNAVRTTFNTIDRRTEIGLCFLGAKSFCDNK
jgi:hypothetical protein